MARMGRKGAAGRDGALRRPRPEGAEEVGVRSASSFRRLTLRSAPSLPCGNGEHVELWTSENKPEFRNPCNPCHPWFSSL
jgi:hypothetical protein